MREATMHNHDHGTAARTTCADFLRGFIALLPLWIAAIPSGIAYGVAARGTGLSAVEAQLMSLLVFSAAAQVGSLALLGGQLPGALLVGTAMILNAQLLLLGLTAGRRTRPRWRARLLAAFFLTDGAFAVAAGQGRLRLSVLIGAGMSMYTAWNAGTAIGPIAGGALLAVRGLGIDFVLPLIFLALLVPLVRSRPALAVALIAGLGTIILARMIPAGLAVLVAGIAASLSGAWWSRGAAEASTTIAQQILAEDE